MTDLLCPTCAAPLVNEPLLENELRYRCHTRGCKSNRSYITWTYDGIPQVGFSFWQKVMLKCGKLNFKRHRPGAAVISNKEEYRYWQICPSCHGRAWGYSNRPYPGMPVYAKNIIHYDMGGSNPQPGDLAELKCQQCFYLIEIKNVKVPGDVLVEKISIDK